MMNERIPYLREKTAALTGSPGVYIMKQQSGQIIYIGKAKNLKKRVTSYFCRTPNHTPKVAKMPPRLPFSLYPTKVAVFTAITPGVHCPTAK